MPHASIRPRQVRADAAARALPSGTTTVTPAATPPPSYTFLLPHLSDDEPLLVESAGETAANGRYNRVRPDEGGHAYANAAGCRITFRSDFSPTFVMLHGWGLSCLRGGGQHHLYVTKGCKEIHPTRCHGKHEWLPRKHHGTPPVPSNGNASAATAPATIDDSSFGRRTVHALTPRAVPPERLRHLPVGSPLPRVCSSSLRVSAFSYVRDEVDVVADWIHYHASLFGGYQRLHIVDNNTTDGTLDVLHHLASTYGIKLYTAKDFRLGAYNDISCAPTLISDFGATRYRRVPCAD